MKKEFLLFLLLFLTPSIVWCQDKIYVFDSAELHSIIFKNEDSNRLDTTSNRYKSAKINVLEYCAERLDFKIDSSAVHISCTEYAEVNSNATRKERKTIKRQNIKYLFKINFQIEENVTYYTSFYLDTMMQVQQASKWLFNGGAIDVWNIGSWESISKKISNSNIEYILPIYHKTLRYSEKYDQYVYIVLQDITEKTTILKASKKNAKYQLNKLIVDAVSGKVLKRTKYLQPKNGLLF